MRLRRARRDEGREFADLLEAVERTLDDEYAASGDVRADAETLAALASRLQSLAAKLENLATLRAFTERTRPREESRGG